ncbi:MBL fold metallo-hydrolase [Pandoraea commovens]|uniref:MBL fold metallo-hydrolase n=1 Tax=Pandoraea commovens TaxID=2508289 RepID=A0A5E4RN93_9BURK|nr:MBL fold metallo-hydrolase [Pandoraea commovens]UVA81976.1 MBL fold metallo-hydrolase [Pandoraea commovens]VVD63862.1 MBL fold metallo-hydrolase [Pandoraea commovens]
MKLKSQGKNHASFDFGELQIIALRDGYADLPPTRLRTGSGALLSTSPVGLKLVDGHLRLSVNAFLIIDKDVSVLVDTGASNTWHDTTGTLLEGLKEAGVERDSVSYVALTHTHEDHVNGLIAPDGSEAFPRLKQVFVAKEEISVFTGRLAPLRSRVCVVEDGARITDRVSAIRAVGHSPGHTAYEATSSAGRLLAWGDLVHVPSVQFFHPDIAWEYDDDPTTAVASRKSLLQRQTQPNLYVAGAHLDFPGIGRVTERDGAFAFHAVAGCGTVPSP